MTPTQKAEQLVDKFYPLFSHSMAIVDAKKCAIIVVDELMAITPQTPDNLAYLAEVKQEINNVQD